MKTLTLHQPWASLVALGVKSIETRSWSTRYRGPLAIHAGKGWGPICPDGGACTHDCTGRCYRLSCCGPLSVTGWDSWPDFPSGAVVATCTLADVVPMAEAGQQRPQEGPFLTIYGDKLTLFETPATGLVVDDQLPYGDFAPGRFAWLLDDVKPTTERCPACARSFVALGGPCYPTDYLPECAICGDRGYCDPIPAKGRQGLWEWDPLADAGVAAE